MAYMFVSIVLLVPLLAALYSQQRKITRIDRATWDLPAMLDEKTNLAELRLYRQIEALTALNALIRPVLPLPPLRAWAGSPDFLLELARCVMLKKPSVIVECSSGASSVVAARCCQLNGSGHVYSLEHERVFAEATRERLREQGLDDWATVIDAPLETGIVSGGSYSWYTLRDLPDRPIDLLVVDGPPASLGPFARYPAGPKLLPRLSGRGAVLVDDADRDDERQIVQRWQDEFPALKARQVIAEKGLVVLEQAEPGLIQG
jgi:rhodanese-related sulfurtransferase